MITKHETTSEMVKRLLAVIESRISKAGKGSEDPEKSLEPTL